MKKKPPVQRKKKTQLLEKAYQLANIGTWEFNMQTQELYWTTVTKEVHGFGPDYEPDLESTINLFKEGINRNAFEKAARNAIDKKEPFDVELKIISGKGDERWIRAAGEPEYKNGICTRFYGISQNVSDRRKAEENLQVSEQRFRSLIQDGSDLIVILDANGTYTYVSPTSQSILGAPPLFYLNSSAFDYIHPDDSERLRKVLKDLIPGQRIHILPYRFRDPEGNWRWMETTMTNLTKDPSIGGLVANSRDVTENILQQRKNLDSLKEKETLLAEIHHRVKNNLAVVSGILQLQITEEDNSELTERLSDSIVRIKTMANIHEQLYQSNSFSRVEFSHNIRSLIKNIQQTFQSNAKIDFNISCCSLDLNINQAIPTSLIVNEVVTNIFKHAFPDNRKGKVAIELEERQQGKCVSLAIRDDGVGFPNDLDVSKTNSLGMSLIDVLSQQLEGSYTYVSGDSGTLFTLKFKKEALKGSGSNLLD